MQTIDYFYIEFDKEKRKINRDNTNLLFNINFENELFKINGHFIDFDNISDRDFVECITNNNYVHLHSKFLLYLYNKKTKALSIISDVSCGFPVYYFESGNIFYCSTDYEHLKKIHPNLKIDDYALIRQIISVDSSFYHNHIFQNPVKLLPFQEINIENENLKTRYIPNIINRQSSQFKSINDLAESYYSDIQNIFKKYYLKHADENICSDLSTGFDSTMICHLLVQNGISPKLITNLNTKTNKYGEDYSIVDKWLAKHSLKHLHTYQHIDEDHSASSYKNVTDANYAIFVVDNYSIKQKYEKNANSTLFTGNGGDDIFSYVNPTYLITNPHKHYLGLMKVILKYDLQNLLTSNGMKYIFDYDYNDFPLIDLEIANNSTYYYEIFFKYSYMNNIKIIHPFLDRRLSQYKYLKPIPGIDKKNLRQQIYQNIPQNIYLPDHFIQEKKQNFKSLYYLYIQNFRRDFNQALPNLHPTITKYFDIDAIDKIVNINDSKNLNQYVPSVVEKIFAVDNYLKKYGR